MVLENIPARRVRLYRATHWKNHDRPPARSQYVEQVCSKIEFVQALTLLIEQRLIIDVAQFAGNAQLKVLPPLCPLGVSSTDFSHAGELIDRAHTATGDWLDAGGPSLPAPERFLSLHHHRGSEHPSDEHTCNEGHPRRSYMNSTRLEISVTPTHPWPAGKHR